MHTCQDVVCRACFALQDFQDFQEWNASGFQKEAEFFLHQVLTSLAGDTAYGRMTLAAGREECAYCDAPASMALEPKESGAFTWVDPSSTADFMLLACDSHRLHVQRAYQGKPLPVLA